jgi:ketosteroid isomerase-like protein
VSRENIELALRACRAASGGQDADFAAVNELFHPEHVLVSIGATKLGEAEAVGGVGYRDWLRDTSDTMRWSAEVDGAVDVGPHTVLVACTNHMTGVASGADVSQRFWVLMTIASGKIVRTEAFIDPAEALDAARESPQ